MYATVLGDSWRALDEVIRRFHESHTVRRARGVFRVRHGTGLFARVAAWLAGMPPAADAVNVNLVVTPNPDGEEWRRMFGDAPLVSIQTLDRSSVVERFGAIEVRFGLDATADTLHYRFESARLRIAGVPLPLPLVASAHERARADGRIDVAVDVAMMMIGRIIAYDGTLTLIEVVS